ncbi:MAG: biopolymer transporter ExbD [Glaciimonas sp.]|nr:biopolymer transporter ExbD [Glaciimonas sp.]
MKFRKVSAREDPEINLIPFIDVLLVILIFLMVTTTYSKFSELHITLPSADAEKVQQRPFEINVGVSTDNSRYVINNTTVAYHDVQELAESLKTAAMINGVAQNDPVVIISADGAATHQSVINVLEAARLAQFAKVTFATQVSTSK